MKETKPRSARAKVPFTLEVARKEALEKITKGGAKGKASLVTAKTIESKRLLYHQALETLESEGAIYVDRSKAKPKYFSREFAPSVPGAAWKMEQWAARRHPNLVTLVELKKALAANEKIFALQSLESLETRKRLVKFMHGKSVVYAHGDSVRALLGSDGLPSHPAQAISDGAIRSAYENLVRLNGFPDVEIAALQRHASVPMAALKEWLLAEHGAGRANFSISDWSLSDDVTRAGVIEMRGDRYLAVRLEN